MYIFCNIQHIIKITRYKEKKENRNSVRFYCYRNLACIIKFNFHENIRYIIYIYISYIHSYKQ